MLDSTCHIDFDLVAAAGPHEEEKHGACYVGHRHVDL